MSKIRKRSHEWQQSTKEAEEIIPRLTFPDTGDVVLDLMMGAGTNIRATLNCGAERKGIGIEIIKLPVKKLEHTYLPPQILLDESHLEIDKNQKRIIRRSLCY